MTCTNPYPKRIVNPHWDGSNPLTKFTYILCPCGKCLACRINRRREWTLRLLQEEIYSKSSFFITLTYDEDHVPFDVNGNMSVSVRDVQLWIKRLRKKYDVGIRYMINSEYGELGRPHYHGVFFNLPDSIMSDAKVIKRFERGHLSISYHSPSFEKIWGLGNVEFSQATKERCGYAAKYFVVRKEVDELLTPNFSLCSRGGKSDNNLGGIGSRYAKDISSKVRSTGSLSMFHPSTGLPVAIPRLYKKYIFSEDELKKLTEDYIDNYELSSDLLSMYENHQLVEYNQQKAITYKHIKQKL